MVRAGSGNSDAAPHGGRDHVAGGAGRQSLSIRRLAGIGDLRELVTRRALIASLFVHGLLCFWLVYHLVIPRNDVGAPHQARIEHESLPEPEFLPASEPPPLEEPEAEVEPEALTPKVEDDLLLPAPWRRPEDDARGGRREDLRRPSEILRRARPLPRPRAEVPEQASEPPERPPTEEPPAAAPTESAARTGSPRVGASKLRDLCPSPRYPRQAVTRHLEGRVILIVDVDRDGRVLDVVIETSSGHDILDRAAVDAVEDWRFAPAREGDQTVRDRLRIPITFRLPER
ncbi:MAG: energy transducer TonB [Planctomycetes bacterium]|nr:energy transducer TonB [Planctomycetota bacterium]